MLLKNEKIWQFLDGLSDSAPTPGGGSAAALSGALGAALVSMVARLTIENDKYAPVKNEMKKILRKSEKLRADLLISVDQDSEAYTAVMTAYRMPKDDDKQKIKRSKAIQKAMKKATHVPFLVASRSLQVLELAEVLSSKGFANAISDVGVGALLADTAVRGAAYNVKINLSSIKDTTMVARVANDISLMLEASQALCKKVENNVNQKLSQG